MARGQRRSLTEAAALARDAPTAFGFVERAARADPTHLPALQALAAGHRSRGDMDALLPVLRALVAVAPADDGTAHLKLELAGLLIARGERDEARALLEPLAAGGRSAPGYSEALELLVPLLSSDDDALARATVLAARAELQKGPERARLLLAAAQAAHLAGDDARAARLARASVATEASQDALLLLAGLMRDSSELAKAPPRSPRRRSSRSGGPTRLLLGAPMPGRERGPRRGPGALERVARLHPATSDRGLGNRFLRLGARAAAIERGYEPLLAQGAFAQALEIAERLEDPAASARACGSRPGSSGRRAAAPAGQASSPRHRGRASGVRRPRRVPPGDGPRRLAPPGHPPRPGRRRPGRSGSAPSSD